MKNGLISVIVPVYKTEQYLKRCIESILNQTYTNLEIILVNDGSPDKCPEIIDSYKKKDSRIITIHQKNGGQSSARNTGIKRASGQYISFVDSDDELHKDFYKSLIESFNDNVDLTMSGMLYRKLYLGTEESVYLRKLRPRGKNEPLQNYVLRLLVADGRLYSVLNKLFRASIIKENALRFEEGLYFAEDTEFVLRYLNHISGQINFVLKPYYFYNHGTANSTIKTTGTDKKNWDRSFHYLKRWCGKLNFTGKCWLMLVRLRWQVSYIRSVRRSKQQS